MSTKDMLGRTALAAALAAVFAAVGVVAATAQDAPVVAAATPEEPTPDETASTSDVGPNEQACDQAGCVLTSGRYHVRLPDGEGPHPVVLLLHNAGEDAAVLADDPVLRATVLAGEHALIVPVGLTQRFADGSAASSWRLTGTESGGRDEISFLETVLADAERRHGIDRERVLITGHGLGGSLTWEAACLSPELANAFVPRNGGFWGSLPEDCAGPMRLMHVHAPAVDGWPLTEALENDGDGATAQPIEAHLELAREANGCGESAPLSGGLPAGHDGLSWQDCNDEAELALVLHRDQNRTTEPLLRHILAWFSMPQSAADTAEEAEPEQ
ncbi:MAG: hypothetical protein AAF416_07965 [Pseudomonadota bacterium]